MPREKAQVWVVCELCHHEAVFNVDGYGDAVSVPAFGPRMVCTSCGIVDAFARPNGGNARRKRA
jgi:hypothetical protein